MSLFKSLKRIQPRVEGLRKKKIKEYIGQKVRIFN